MPLYVIERSFPEGLALAPTELGRQAATSVVGNSPTMAKNPLAARVRRWLSAWYAALMESSRISGVDWTGWRVD